ncbi:MAG: bifunctional phosphopantothenoylcysteine decarboxylase/phosphopantothenate--cysteine ligase CoaBC [Alphaproteobacteria bacterium]|nr:bifunctional phosphopantothenoylcysteine decarboxylase/phosphopantothenate--cysteine ligase CoaBC [Alphaproteobacteria bacterium]
MKNKRILLIIGGGIAAYKCLDLIRRLRERGAIVRVVMTGAAQQFITPLSVSALTNERVFTELFDLNDEREIGHIRLSREADAILVAPATADIIAKMAGGHANDLATSVLLASDKPPLIAPAMNPRMWLNPATQRNVARLKADGVRFVGPDQGEMAERGEAGPGRMSETPDLIAALSAMLGMGHSGPDASGPLSGKHVVITSGPTHEPIDPVRYIANRSSGKQGHAIAAAAQRAGARVTLISGPVTIPDPAGVDTWHIETASEMKAAVAGALPADIAVFCAAVADWRVDNENGQKIKKAKGAPPPALSLVANPDILKTVASLKSGRPRLVVGFAAETEKVLEHAQAKLKSKGCDLIVANDVSSATGVMGGDRNCVHLVTRDGVTSWPEMGKDEVAQKLVEELARLIETGVANQPSAAKSKSKAKARAGRGDAAKNARKKKVRK